MSTVLNPADVPAGPVPLPPPPEPRHWLRTFVLVVVAAIAGAAGGLVSHAFVDGGTGPATVSVAPAETLPRAPLDVGAVVATVAPAVVRIEARQAEAVHTGTGIVVTADGKVLTCAHVIAHAVTITVFRDGGTQELSARRIVTDRLTDIALLQIVGASRFPVAPLASSAQARVGDDVLAMGHALDMAGGPTVSRGILSGVDRALTVDGVGLTGLLQTDASVSSGNSGGPLVDATGHVIGMITTVATGDRGTIVENINFVVPADTIVAVLRAFGVVVTAP